MPAPSIRPLCGPSCLSSQPSLSAHGNKAQVVSIAKIAKIVGGRDSRPVAQYHAGIAALAQASAQTIRAGPRVGPDPHLIERVCAARAQRARDDDRVEPAQALAMALLDIGIGCERALAREAG